MTDIHIENIKDELVLYFDTPDKSVNAYTLASALVALADAAKETNKVINPGYEVEVIVTALADGSFKAVIRTIYKELKNLFSAESLKAIILSIIATMVYEKFIAQKPNISVNVTDKYVIVATDNEKVIIPKDVYEATKLVEKSNKVTSKIDTIGQAAKKDEKVIGIGVSGSITEKPELIIKREKFDQVFCETVMDEGDIRENVEITTVEIMRAILEESNRLWEFVWYGNRISAPVLDEDFYKRFREHKITIAPGDKFKVKMKIIQKKDPGSGVFINQKYEVIEVLNHNPRIENTNLSDW